MIELIVGDNRGHTFLKDICDMIWQLPNGEGDVWIYDDNKKEPALKYELKSLSDFWDRLTSDSLNMQLEGVNGIVLIGEVDFNWDFARLYNVINGVEDHTKVYRVRDTKHLKQFLRLREKKVKDGTYGLITKVKPKVREYPPMVEMLTNIPKISYTIATRIYEEFNSLEDLLNEAKKIKGGEIHINQSRFVRIDKVGKVIAERMVDWLLQEWPKREIRA